MRPRPAMLITGLIALGGCAKGSSSESEAAPSRFGAEMPDWKAAISHQVRFDAALSTVVVDVHVQPGFHAYTTGETTGQPLRLTVSDASDYRLTGDVEYPSGLQRDLPIGKSVIVEGEVQVRAPVAAKSEAAEAIRGAFRFQVCTDEACDRPRTVDYEVPAR